MSETKFTREYLHEQLNQLREAFGTEDFWSKPGAVETANKAIWFVYFQTESPTEFDKLRVEATLDELKKRWEYIKLIPFELIRATNLSEPLKLPANYDDRYRNEALARAYLDGRNALHAGKLRELSPELDDLEKINWEYGYDDAYHEQLDESDVQREQTRLCSSCSWSMKPNGESAWECLNPNCPIYQEVE